MKHILITNAWHDDNKGDSGIILGIMELFRQKEDTKFYILSEFSNEDSKFKNAYRHIKEKFPSTIILTAPWPLLPSKTYKNKFLEIVNKIIEKVIKNNFENKYRSEVTSNLTFLKLLVKQSNCSDEQICNNNKGLGILISTLKKVDLVISKGGSFIYSDNTFYSNMRLARVLFPLYLGLALKKRTVIFGQSIWGIDSGLSHRISYPILKNSYIYTREEITSSYIKDMLNLKSLAIPDPAFYLSSLKGATKMNPSLEMAKFTQFSNSKAIIIGLTVREWRFKSKDKDYVKKIVDLCFKLKNKFQDIKFIFIPQVIGPVYLEDDRIIMNEIQNSFRNELDFEDKFLFMYNDYSPYELKYIYSQLTILIGTRLHSLIFALSEGTPGVALAYSANKHRGVMKMMGLEDCVFQIDGFQTEEVVYAVINILNSLKFYKQQVEKKCESFRNILTQSMYKIVTDNNWCNKIELEYKNLDWIDCLLEEWIT